MKNLELQVFEIKLRLFTKKESKLKFDQRLNINSVNIDFYLSHVIINYKN